jgi:superfamily I DNA/RNA helicase
MIELDFTESARTWSPQQEAIFEWFANGSGNLTVRARAGTGKTTTIIEGINRAIDGAIMLCAFNKRIADELSDRIDNPHAVAKTLHAIGFAAVRTAWSVRVAEGTKRAWSLTERVCGSKAPDDAKRLVNGLHTKAREMLPHATRGEDLREMALDFDLAPTAEFLSAPGFADYTLEWVCERAVEAMEIAANEKPVVGIDFADMLFLPLRNGWLRPMYDLVVVDEAQDMNAAQLEMAQKITKVGGRIAVIGDDRQAIYGFRGADSNALDRLKKELGAVELPLNTTYRCGSEIVREAQALVPDFNCPEGSPTGRVSSIEGLEALVAAARPEDFILSRKNAPLAQVAMAFIRAQKRVRIEGRDIGSGLKAIVAKLKAGSIPELLEKLEAWERKEVARWEAAERPQKAEAAIDTAATIRVLTEGVVGPQELLARIDGLFADYGKNMTVCSSVHKAKGLEADQVFVLSQTLYAKFGKKDEEANIAYVAITRAKKSLVWVEGVK